MNWPKTNHPSTSTAGLDAKLRLKVSRVASSLLHARLCVRDVKKRSRTTSLWKGAAPETLVTMDQLDGDEARELLRFLGDSAGLEEVGEVGGVGGIAEIRSDVENILPGA